MNVCKTCHHPDRAAIDKALVTGTPTREVAVTYGLARASVRRHADAHLPERLKRAQERTEAADDVDVYAELRCCLSKLTRFLAACEATFADPDDPERYDLSPRGTELTVIYERFDGDRFVTRKATLQDLLDEAAGAKRATVHGIENRAADTRELFLKTFARLQPTLELLGKLTGEVPLDQVNVVLWQSPDWLAVQAGMVRALASHPDAQRAVLGELAALSAEDG